MKLVVSHTKPDFDALASLALARLAHPGAVATVTGSLDERVEAFIHLYRDRLELVDAADIDLGEVKELVVVDTSDPKRIAPFDALIGKVPITVYDHHPHEGEVIPAAKGLHQRLGATATILTLLLKARDIAIPADLASLALLGIHEDTGNLAYNLTQPEDHEAAAQLLRAGASLGLVRDFSREPYDAEHREVLSHLLRNLSERDLHGHQLVVTSLKSDTYIPSIAPLCNQILDLHGADAALIVAEMQGKTLLIARAKGEAIDVGAALFEAFDGGGHPGAAFARSELPLQAALDRALSALARHSHPARTARDLMSRPVKTVREGATIAEAQALLARYGHNGLPVLGADGKLVGIISRRDLERARRHGLGRSEVRGFMTKEVVTAEEEASQRELEALVEKHNVGRIPILRGERLVGIVTRTDLIAARHAPASAARNPAEACAQEVLESLPPGTSQVLETATERLEEGALYLVGGTVRDALLKTGMQDLDLVVEGDSAERLGAALQGALGGRLSCHLDFGTCSLELPGGLMIDLATAREEFYEHPGALPSVTPSTLRKDLSRRDFSINALAVRLTPKPVTLLDPYGGLEDLRAGVLRPLHPLSFVEDPTRILRGARLAGRLGFSFHPDVKAQIEVALGPEILGKTSRSRLRGELLLTLAEPRVAPALALLEDCGALHAMFDIKADLVVLERLDALRQEGPVPDESYLLVLLLSLPEARLEAHREAFGWPKRLFEARRALKDAARTAKGLEAAGEALRAALKALHPALKAEIERFERAPQRQRLRGQDVLDLGLPAGPFVGEVLKRVAEARAVGEVGSFEEELGLARRLVQGHLAAKDQE